MSAVFKQLDSMNNIVFQAGPVLSKQEHAKLVASFYIYRKAYNWHLIASRYTVQIWQSAHVAFKSETEPTSILKA